MTYSLINVVKDNGDGTVQGYWMQDSIGSLAKAQERARATEAANSNRLTIAVCKAVRSAFPILDEEGRHRLAS